MASDDRGSRKKKASANSDFVYPLNFSIDKLEEMTGSGSKESLALPADIYENKDFVFLDIEVPGIEPEKISVALDGQKITIEGVKKEEHAPKKASFHCAERNFGFFRREFGLGQTVDTGNITATFKNGILHLTIPKLKERRKNVHKIKVLLDD